MATTDESGSPERLAEAFDLGEDAFLHHLRAARAPKALAAFAARWSVDPRPWARAQLLRYLDGPLDRPGHEVLVKRLFKHAEAHADDELMAAFLVAFDRLVRRVRKWEWRWDSDLRSAVQREALVSLRDVVPPQKGRTARHPATGQRIEVPVRVPKGGLRLFRYHTRYYVRRRAWRYFRRMGFQRPAGYPEAVARALVRYRDDDLQQGEHLLDSWGLLHACFQGHGAVRFTASRAGLVAGASLAQLEAAPVFPDLWRKDDAFPVLMSMVLEARSRLVRLFAMQLLRREHAQRLQGLSPDQVLAFLRHPDPEVQMFGADVLRGLSGLGTLALDTWLAFLDAESPTALHAICEMMAQHVRSDRLSLAQCVELALQRPVPVAELGRRFLAEAEIATEEGFDLLASLADARCPSVAGGLAAFALAIVGDPARYDLDRVCRFFDSLLREVRDAAWAWLEGGGAGWDDPALFARLTETPFDDVRLHVVDALAKRAGRPRAGASDLRPLWSAVLLNVHRGNRQKRKAIDQIEGALRAEPKRAAALLPVLAVAVRSVRGPELRAGIAAVVRLVEGEPALAEAVGRLLPELDLAPAETTA